MLTGEPITAERAYAAGLVNVLTEPGGALEAAVALAERVCANAPVALTHSMWVRDRAGTALGGLDGLRPRRPIPVTPRH